MIALAVGLGVLGLFALRRARRRCFGGGYGWYGPWADYSGAYGDYPEGGAHDGHDGHGELGGEDGEHRHGHGWHGGPPWMHGHHRRGRGGGWRGPGGAWRGRGGWRGGRRGRWMLHAALSRIEATPAQERVIVGELERLEARIREARIGVAEARGDLAAALRGPILDDAALGAVLGRVDGATSEARAAALDALRNIHTVLDEKQRTAVAEMLERRGAGRGRGGGGAGWFRTSPYR